MNSVRIRVRFYETDMAGIVHHTNHIRWFEMGRVAFLRENRFELKRLIELGYMTPILSVKCEYKTAANFDDVLVLETRLIKMSRTRSTFSFYLTRETDGALIAVGETQNTFSDLKTGNVKPLTKEIYSFFSKMVEPPKEA